MPAKVEIRPRVLHFFHAVQPLYLAGGKVVQCELSPCKYLSCFFSSQVAAGGSRPGALCVTRGSLLRCAYSMACYVLGVFCGEG